MSRSFAISDIHGCSNTFKVLVEELIKLTKEDHLYLLGDYIDRGPDSKGVIDYILDLKVQGFQITLLKGNHEEMMLKSRTDSNVSEMWRRNGGDICMSSFGVETLEEIPEKYWEFLSALELYALTDECVLVHAGLNMDLEDPFSDTESMLWMRKFIVDPEKTGNRIIVHGHTPVSSDYINENIALAKKDFQINIDNGCVFKDRGETFGSLCCLNLKTLEVYFYPSMD